MDLGFGPDEGFCVLIVSFDEGVDVGDEVLDAGEGSAVERLQGQDREPDFDLTEPGGVGRRVVEMNVLVAAEPHVAIGLVGGEIVENHVDFALRIIGDDPVHEIEEFDAPASLVVAADDLAAGDVQRRKQRGRAVPLIVMRLTGQGSPVGQLEIALRSFKPNRRGIPESALF